MSHARRFNHVGTTVADVDTVTALNWLFGSEHGWGGAALGVLIRR
jgi:hypothetical protein